MDTRMLGKKGLGEEWEKMPPDVSRQLNMCKKFKPLCYLPCLGLIHGRNFQLRTNEITM